MNTRPRSGPVGIEQLGLALLVLLGAGMAQAADHYVRPNGGSYGTETGVDWSNAFDGFSDIDWSGVEPGDTIWVAGGTYSGALDPQASGTASNPIKIRRARADASACTGAAGWSASFDSTVHQVRSGIVFRNRNYITVSGRTRAGGGQQGWWIDYRGATAGIGVNFPNGATARNIVVEYVTLQGPGAVTYSGNGRGIDDTPFSSAANHTFSHLDIFDWESGVYVAGMSSPTFEYIDMYDIHAANWPTYHPNGIYTSGAPNGIVRYSRFHEGPKGRGTGEGIFFQSAGGSTGWQIYGNVFYKLDDVGQKAIQITSNVGNIKIFNNTFDNIITSGVYVNGGSCGSGAEVRNNLAYDTSFSSCGTNSHNLVVSTTSVWVNQTTRDYRIVDTIASGYPRDAGTALASSYSHDVSGTSRGGDGKWDVGAYEFTSCTSCAPDPPPSQPLPPTNLRIVTQQE